METIDYAIFYYQNIGYKYIESPWIISPLVSNITKPCDRNDFYVGNDVLVASGEQSFLELIIRNEIDEGKYMTYTPCFRDESVDELHKLYFHKIELIKWSINKDKINDEELMNTINDAVNFYSKYIKVEILKTDIGYDIIDSKNKLELGSYGIRNYGDTYWIYGTGCAEPRLSHIISKNKNIGYHLINIPKSKIGTFDKILEEVIELKDAKLQGNKIMELVELSDLIGSIKYYVKQEYKMDLSDLIKMSETTERAFVNGERKN